MGGVGTGYGTNDKPHIFFFDFFGNLEIIVSFRGNFFFLPTSSMAGSFLLYIRPLFLRVRRRLFFLSDRFFLLATGKKKTAERISLKLMRRVEEKKKTIFCFGGIRVWS